MAFDLVLSPAAMGDLDEIIGFYSLLNPTTALRYLDSILASLRRLPDLPESGRVVPEFQAQGEKRYRELIVEQFRAIYRLQDERILFVRIVDGRRLISTSIA